MCGRIIQSGGPVRYATVDGMDVRDSRLHNYPPRWNAAPSQELLVIRRNPKTGEASPDPRDLMRPFPADPMRMWPVSIRVNKPENDDAAIVEPVELA
jgi:putative SOS response-associated peptidase YedK